jgi:flavin reductase (DIM6/NTAB) family NADH-FMN oxidoreductase RutF
MTSPRLDLEDVDSDQINDLFTAVVAPRAVGWVVTRSTDGAVDAAPFSSLAPVCNKPPLVLFAAQRTSGGAQKMTTRNILATKEYLVHIVDQALLRRAIATACPGDLMTNKLARVEVETVPSNFVGLPRIANCPVALECVLYRHVVLGEDSTGADLIVGRVQGAWVSDARDPASVVAALGIGDYLIGGRIVSIPNPLG